MNTVPNSLSAPVSAHPFSVSLKTGTQILCEQDSRTVAKYNARVCELGGIRPGTLATLKRLVDDCLTLEELVAEAMRHDPPDIGELLGCVTMLADAGLISHVLMSHGARVAALAPLQPGFDYRYTPVADSDTFRPAPFLNLTACGSGMHAASPLAKARVELFDWRASAVLHAVTQSQSLADTTKDLPDLGPGVAEHLISLLLSAGLLLPGDTNQPGDDLADDTQFWQAADLGFHQHSRRGYSDAPFGATFPGLGQTAPLSVVKSPMSANFIDLFSPDIDTLMATDPPFSQVLETRRSERAFGEIPMTVKELGEFLFRTARVRSIAEAGAGHYQSSSRPYPNGGACYELEFYVAVESIQGLAPGLYHYAPDRHRLYVVRDQDAAVGRLLDDARRSSGAAQRPHALIVLSARFGRVMWKYQGMGYALILKNVGAAMQTMYLAATTMKLAGCALGGGDAALFARMSRADPLTEASVGEFMIGSRRDDPQERGGQC